MRALLSENGFIHPDFTLKEYGVAGQDCTSNDIYFNPNYLSRKSKSVHYVTGTGVNCKEWNEEWGPSVIKSDYPAGFDIIDL